MWHEWARDAYRILVGKSEEKRLLGKYDGGGDNTNTDLKKKISSNGVDWIDLAEDSYKWRAVVNAVMNLRTQ